MPRARLVTHNLPGRVGPRGAVTALNKTLRYADIAVWQEAREFHRQMKRRKNFDGKFDPEPYLSPLPIMWRSRLFTPVRFHAYNSYENTRVGSWGAGPPVMKAAWENGVTLKHKRSKKKLHVFDAHLAPSVTRLAFTESAKGAREIRRELHELEVEGLIEATDHLKGAVAIGMDANCGPGYKGLNPLRDAGFQIISAGVTKGKRGKIDLWAIRDCEFVGGKKVIRTPSDHHAARIIVEF